MPPRSCAKAPVATRLNIRTTTKPIDVERRECMGLAVGGPIWTGGTGKLGSIRPPVKRLLGGLAALPIGFDDQELPPRDAAGVEVLDREEIEPRGQGLALGG